jgi:DNA-damage-inducible protein D
MDANTMSNTDETPAASLNALTILGQSVGNGAAPLEGDTKSDTFQGCAVRGHFHNGEWWLSIVDVINALEVTTRPSKYWSDLRTKLIDEEGFFELSDKIGKFKMMAADGKMRPTDAVTVAIMLRVMQSIPSPKVEPLKQWLAQVGYERLQEVDDPSKALERLIGVYINQGRTPEWIRERIDGIITRRELTDEWKARGIKKSNHYLTLTRMLQIRSIGMGPKELREHKGLASDQSVRDHSTELELLFTRLGERTTIEIAQQANAQGYEQNRDAVVAGGDIAKHARESLEKLTGQKVASKKNFLPSLPSGS